MLDCHVRYADSNSTQSDESKMKRILAVLLAVFMLPIAPPLEARDTVCVVSSDSVPGVQQPQVAVNNAGHIFVAFGANENIFVCKSVDSGRTYSGPRKIGQASRLALGMRRGPRIVTHGDSVIVSAIGHDSGNLMAWRSGDGGETWHGPADVNDQARSAREGLHDMAVGTDGLVFCSWLDLRSGSTQVFGASSQDGGKSWSKNRLVYASPSGTVCECCHPSVAISNDGVVFVMWRNELDGNRDMYLARSQNGGRTFDLADKLGVGSWKLKACPMDGGDLAIGSGGSPITVWRRDRQVYATGQRAPRESLLGQGEQPVVTTADDGTYVVWLTRRRGDLLHFAPNTKTPTRLARNASDPDIATPRSGDGPVVAVWESGVKPKLSIMAAVIAE